MVENIKMWLGKTKENLKEAAYWKRIAYAFFGNVIMGLGIALLKLGNMGQDPFNGMNMAVSATIGMDYAFYQLLFNLILFIFQIITARELIGLGTLLNATLVAYFVKFYLWLFSFITLPETIIMSLILVVFAVLFCSLGIAMYQEGDLGIAPFDALPYIIGKKLKKVPFFWRRIMVDGSAALVCFLFGGSLGVSTLLAAFGFGPVIHFFSKYLFKHKL